jgi:acyl-coenzyme A synthetase/AMP-(fatty) acid ligase
VLAIVDELPRSPMGKIQRPRLREMVQRQGRVIGRVASGLGQ